MSDIVGPTGSYTPEQIEQGKPLSAVGYVPLCCLPLFLVPMLAAKENPYAQYHARQGAVLYICTIVGAIALTIVSIAIGLIGSRMLGCLLNIASIGFGGAVFVVMVIGIVNALQGQAKELPVIGQFASKLPF